MSADGHCIRCADRPAVDYLGYCGFCHWIAVIEVEVGLDEIATYLANWARFAEWCERV
jgi:hypothetical protein